MMDGTSLTEEAVRAALRNVDDPEVGMNIVDLGLVYGVVLSTEGVHIDLTMTSPACPLGDVVIDDAVRAVLAVAPAGMNVDVDLVWDPPWSPNRMSERARRELGWPD
jgi:metal-sulfur cluster biosynthetic enzyme